MTRLIKALVTIFEGVPMVVPAPTITKIKNRCHPEERSDEGSRSPHNEIPPFGRNDKGTIFEEDPDAFAPHPSTKRAGGDVSIV